MKKGDHLVSPRSGFSHHGIYVGGGKVIHYAGLNEGFSKGTVEVTTLAEFEQGRGSSVEWHPFSLFNAEERVNRAYARLGEDKYNVFKNNCEHFATWCHFGFGNSKQVNRAALVTTVAVNPKLRSSIFTAGTAIANEVSRRSAQRAGEAALVKIAAGKLAKAGATTGAKELIASKTLTGIVAGGVGGSALSSMVGGGMVGGKAALALAATPAAPIAGIALIGAAVGYGISKLWR